MSTIVHQKRNFFEFFPIPKFLEMPSVGIDISDQAIRFVEIGHSVSDHQKFKLRSFGEKKLAEGVISSGFINKPEEIKRVLSEIRKEHSFKFASVSLPEEKGYLFKTELPNIPEKYIAENIELHLEENVPIDAVKSVFDYSLMRPSASHNFTEAVVTVVPDKVIDVYSDLFLSAQIVPLSYELVTQAVARSVVPQQEMATCIIIHVGDLSTGFGVVSEGALQFTSTVNVGHETDIDTIEKKHQFIKNEVIKLIAYWQGRNNESNQVVKKILISGSGKITPGLKEYLAEATSCYAELANVWVNVFNFENQIPEMSFDDSLDYAPAIGLALSRFYHA
jgi:Tfp pilus assembly PilM family ATPase